MMIQGTRCLRALVWAGMAAGGLATFAGPAAAETLTLRDGRQEIVVVDMQGGEIADMRQEPSDAYKKGPYQAGCHSDRHRDENDFKISAHANSSTKGGIGRP